MKFLWEYAVCNVKMRVHYVHCNEHQFGGLLMYIISYNRLWKLLIDKGMNKNELRNRLNISPATIAKMGK